MYTSIHDIWLLLFVGGTETLLVHFAFRNLMRRNARSRVQYLAALGVYMACTMLDAWLNLPIYFVLLICYFLIAVIAFLFYDNSWEERLIIPFAYVAANYAATIYATTLVHWFGAAGIEAFPEHLQQTFASQVLLDVMVVAFVYALRLLQNAERPSVLLVFFVSFCTPLVTLLLLIQEFYLIPTSAAPAAVLPQYLAIATLLLLTATTLYSLASRIGSLLRSIDYSDSLQQMLGVQERYYATLQEHQVELRQIYHDILNHSRTILKLLNSGLTDEARDYTRKLVSEAESPLTVTECDNKLLGALLNDRLASAKRRGVDLQVCVMVPPALEIDAVDVCILLSNLLDNASEACDRLQRRLAAGEPGRPCFIDVDIRIKGPFLRVRIANSHDGRVAYDSGIYRSTKAEPLVHGTGIPTARMVAERHGGRLSIEHTSDVFCATALLEYPGVG